MPAKTMTGSFNLILLREQTLSFHTCSHIIFKDTKGTSEENTHVDHTILEDREEELKGASVIEDVPL